MKKIIYIIAAFWALVAIFVTYSNEIHFNSNAQDVILRVIPYDPKELLRGDYVTLHYDINTIKKATNRNEEKHFKNHKAYVLLKEDKDGIYYATDITPEPPEDKLYIKGEIIYDTREKTPSGRYETTYRLKYPNIERFYVKEGTGKKLEKKLQKKGGLVRIKLTSKGSARIKEILD